MSNIVVDLLILRIIINISIIEFFNVKTKGIITWQQLH